MMTLKSVHMCSHISFPLVDNPAVMARLQEVTAPNQEIAWRISPFQTTGTFCLIKQTTYIYIYIAVISDL